MAVPQMFLSALCGYDHGAAWSAVSLPATPHVVIEGAAAAAARPDLTVLYVSLLALMVAGASILCALWALCDASKARRLAIAAGEPAAEAYRLAKDAQNKLDGLALHTHRQSGSAPDICGHDSEGWQCQRLKHHQGSHSPRLYERPLTGAPEIRS